MTQDDAASEHDEKIRVLVGKAGLDGHDRGAKVIASAFRDAGFEVIYTGLHQTPEMIARTAVDEDVDVVALSILSGAHKTLFPRVKEELEAEGADEILITGGGIIPEEDMEELREMGIGRLFGPGTATRDAVEYVREWYREREGTREGTSRTSGSGAGAPPGTGSPGGARASSETVAPGTAAPGTADPETAAPGTADPETAAPGTADPETGDRMGDDPEGSQD